MGRSAAATALLCRNDYIINNFGSISRILISIRFRGNARPAGRDSIPKSGSFDAHDAGRVEFSSLLCEFSHDE
jgi:hypothetical protein